MFLLRAVIRPKTEQSPGTFIECTRAAARRSVHTYHWFKITLPNTDQAHDKHQWTTTNFSQIQLYSLMMDRIRSETCRSGF